MKTMNDESQKIEKTIYALELTQLKTLVERVKAGGELSRADLSLLKQLSGKLAASRTLADAQAVPQQPAKKRSGRPPNPKKLAEKIKLQALRDLCDRQAKGCALTGADYQFLEKFIQASLEKAESSKAPAAQLPLPQRLQAFKETMFDSLCWIVRNSKSHMARVSAVQTLKQWSEEDEPPPEPIEAVAFRPEDIKLRR